MILVGHTEDGSDRFIGFAFQLAHAVVHISFEIPIYTFRLNVKQILRGFC